MACASGEYSDGTACVTCTPTNAACAPRVTSAVLQDGFREVVITFNEDTDKGVAALGASPTCSQYFTAATALVIGSGAVCEWPSPSELVVHFDVSATSVVPGTVIGFSASIVPANHPGPAVLLTTPVTAGTDAVTALTAAFTVPTTLPPCTPLVMDASAIPLPGGRPVQYSWTVTAVGDSTADALVQPAVNELNANGDVGRVNISASALTAGVTYHVSLQVTDGFGNTATVGVPLWWGWSSLVCELAALTCLVCSSLWLPVLSRRCHLSPSSPPPSRWLPFKAPSCSPTTPWTRSFRLLRRPPCLGVATSRKGASRMLGRWQAVPPFPAL